MAQYYDFNEFNDKIPFEAVLNHLNISFEQTEKEIKTDKIIVNKEKKLFFYKGTKNGGGVVNFISDLNDCSLRDAAKWLKKELLDEVKKPKRPVPGIDADPLKLHYYEWLEKYGVSEEIAADFEVGLFRGKGIFAKHLCFRMYDKDKEPIGYVGYKIKEEKWHFPKGFKASEHLYNYNRRNGNQFVFLVSSPLEVLKMHAKGHPNSVSLLSPGMSDIQLDLLKTFKYIYLIHPKPDNIVQRLSSHVYIKTGIV